MFYTAGFCINPHLGGYTVCRLYNILYTDYNALFLKQNQKFTKKTLESDSLLSVWHDNKEVLHQQADGFHSSDLLNILIS